MTEHTSPNLPDDIETVKSIVQSVSSKETPFMLTDELISTHQTMLLDQASAIHKQGGGESQAAALDKLHELMADLYRLTEAYFEFIVHEEEDEQVAAYSFASFYTQEQQKRIEHLDNLQPSDEYEVYGDEDVISKSLEATQLYNNPTGEITYSDVLESMFKNDMDTNFEIFAGKVPMNWNDLDRLVAEEVENDEKVAKLYRKAAMKDGIGEVGKDIAKAAISGAVIGLILRNRSH